MFYRQWKTLGTGKGFPVIFADKLGPELINQPGPAFYFILLENVADMRGHRVHADTKLIGNFFVA